MFSEKIGKSILFDFNQVNLYNNISEGLSAVVTKLSKKSKYLKIKNISLINKFLKAEYFYNYKLM